VIEEKSVPAPINPLTIKINMAIFRYVRENFFSKFLPNFQAVVTSDLRTADHNVKVGGVPNSAHVHGLAEDFQLKFVGGALVSEVQAKAAFDQFIKPNWPGFCEFERSSTGEGYHIHAQLSRDISTYTGIVSLAGLGVLGMVVVNSWAKKG
jgi:hypothetical protein